MEFGNAASSIWLVNAEYVWNVVDENYTAELPFFI